MSSIAPHLKELYLNKPECVIDLPEWLLSPEKVASYRGTSRIAIVEIAGRDSFAGAVKSVEEKAFTDLIPTYVYTGTEFGPWNTIEKIVLRLRTRLPEVRVHDLVVLGSPDFWYALNGRFINELLSRYGFYTPCVGCHLYLHSIRIPLSIRLGKVPIISGERERHNGVVKINQIPEALNVYQATARGFGIQLILPLRHIAGGDRITEIIGFEWQAEKGQLDCVLSGNYRGLDGTVGTTGPKIQAYLEEFAGPCVTKIIETYMAGRIPNHVEIATQILSA